MAKLRISSHRLEIEVGRWARPNRIPIDDRKCTGPLKKLFHYAIFQRFFTFFKYINGLSFTIHVINLSCNFVSINHINV